MPSAGIDSVHNHTSIRILAWSKLSINSGWDAADVCSTYWRLYVNNRPGASVKLVNGRHAIQPGQLHFIPPWIRFSCLCQEETEHFYVHFDTIGLPGVVIRELFDRPQAVPLHPGTAAAIDAIGKQTDQRHRQSLAVQWRLKALVYESLALLIESLPAEKAERCQAVMVGDHSVQAALQHIDQHLPETITNRELATLCNFSVDHFIRVFHEVVGQSPAQYIIERRIGRAAQLLLFTKHSIEQIAADTGFANRFYFSRAFKQRMGEPPAAYRRGTRV